MRNQSKQDFIARNQEAMGDELEKPVEDIVRGREDRFKGQPGRAASIIANAKTFECDVQKITLYGCPSLAYRRFTQSPHRCKD